MRWLTPPDMLPALHPHTIHLWHAQLDTYANGDILSEEEKARAARFTFPIHRQRFIAARSILRILLSRYLSRPPQDILFSYTPYGKPYLAENSTGLYFNLSHTQDYALYAISREEKIGVDIEHIKTDRAIEKIAARFFSAYENAQLNQITADKKEAAFFQLWTCKEAFIKAIGEGLSFPLHDFDIALDKETPSICQIKGDKSAASAWSILSISTHAQYAAALAIKTRVDYLHTWEF